jgi:glucosyl-dolichyl phosphate glucuronosyltransferase
MLSVVIPTRNRAELLKSALTSLRSQTLSPKEFEILVIDNGSTDQTKDVVYSFEDLVNLRYFFDSTPGLHVGRHRGLKEARGDILVYGDDDIEAFPTWLEAIADNFADPTVAMVGGNNIPNFESQPPSWLQTLWEKPCLDGHAIPFLSVIELPKVKEDFSPGYVWGCNFSIRKQVLLDAGGFHPDGVPQESIRFRGDGESHVSKYVEQQGLRCVFDARASVKHCVSTDRMTLGYFKKRAFSQGVSDSYRWLRQQQSSNLMLLKGLGYLVQGKRIAQLARDMIFTSKNLASQELTELATMVRQGYWEGFSYHQKVYHQDSAVRDWVHQPNYF